MKNIHRARIWLFLALTLLLISTIPITAQTIDCDAPLEIWQIQGAGEESNCQGERVTTEGNIVTAVGKAGFFIQTPADRSDGNPLTSDGIYVAANTPPVRWGIQAGDIVDVSGRVDELYGFTQLLVTGRRRVTVVSSGNPIPIPLDLTSVDLTPGTPHPLERYEGMLVEVDDVFITATTNYFDEFGISLTGERVFREIGIESDTMPEFAGLGLPEFDLNPELIEVDPPEMGLPVEQITTGSRASVVGGLAYAYRDYQLWPVDVTIDQAGFEARSVRGRELGEFTIATQNVLNLFDTVDDPNRSDARSESWTPPDEEAYQRHLNKLSAQIRFNLGAPDILALQEMENSRTLADLILRLHADDPTLRYTGCLLEGNEGRGIDVAYLVRVDHINLLDCYRLPGSLEAKFEVGGPWFTRPPLVLEAEYIKEGGESFPLTLINLHLKSLIDVEADRNQNRRLLQATMVAEYVQQRQNSDPDINLVVLGDFNGFEFSDGLTDVVGIIAGTHDPAEARMAPETDLVEPNLVNQVLRVPADDRYSYIYNSTAQVLDHILTSPALDAFVVDAQFSRGNADGLPEWYDADNGTLRSSDHDGFVIYVRPG